MGPDLEINSILFYSILLCSLSQESWFCIVQKVTHKNQNKNTHIQMYHVYHPNDQCKTAKSVQRGILNMHVFWLFGLFVVSRIYVTLAAFQPYRDLKAGDNQSLRFKWRDRESNPGPFAPQAKSFTTRPPPLPACLLSLHQHVFVLPFTWNWIAITNISACPMCCNYFLYPDCIVGHQSRYYWRSRYVCVTFEARLELVYPTIIPFTLRLCTTSTDVVDVCTMSEAVPKHAVFRGILKELFYSNNLLDNELHWYI